MSFVNISAPCANPEVAAMRTLLEKHSPSLVIVALLLLWEASCRVFNVDPVILPTPSAIWGALVEFKGPIWDHSIQTFYRTIAGFAIAVAVWVSKCSSVTGWRKVAGMVKSRY